MANENKNNGDFNKLYKMMISNQTEMLYRGLYDDCIMIDGSDNLASLPTDNPAIASYNVLHLTSEVSEVLQSDKRWKSIRKNHVDSYEKLQEIADCFICLFNVAIWSGFSANDVLGAIVEKSRVYRERIVSESEHV